MAPADRRLFVQALFALGGIELRLRAWGFRRLAERADRVGLTSAGPVNAEDLAQAQRYARWIETASRVQLVRARCLHRSLVLHEWLRHRGLPSELRIGVRKENGELRAHAWVELGEQVVNDSPAVVAAFTPLEGLDRQGAVWSRRGSGRGLAAGVHVGSFG